MQMTFNPAYLSPNTISQGGGSLTLAQGDEQGVRGEFPLRETSRIRRIRGRYGPIPVSEILLYFYNSMKPGQ